MLVNNYMEKELLKIRGLTRSHPDIDGWRLEMTRYSLQTLFEDTGITVAEVQNRMVDYGYTQKQVRLLSEWYLRVRKSQ